MITLTTYGKRLEKVDPTRTTTLRQSFVRAMNVRFDALARLIRKAIVENDVFGLKNDDGLQVNVGPNAFAFTRSSDKVQAFMKWFNIQMAREILQVSTMQQVGTAVDNAWTNLYIGDSYKRGVQRASAEMRKAGIVTESIGVRGGIETVLENPFHVDRLGLLYTRTFNELKGITQAMDSQISRVLAQGIADGDSPALLGRKLDAVIKGGGADLGIHDTLGRYIPAKRRAQTLARTEIIRAHHKATIQEYRNWGVEGIKVQAEWVTAQDDRVCELCQPLEGNVYTLDEAENMIPVHPNCRCIVIPLEVATEEKVVEKGF